MLNQSKGRRQKVECRSGENLESGIRDNGLGCRGLRLEGRNTEGETTDFAGRRSPSPGEERAGEGKSNKNATPLPGPLLLLRRKRGRRAQSILLIQCQCPQPLAIQWSGWRCLPAGRPPAGRGPTGRVRSSVSAASRAGFLPAGRHGPAGGFAVLSGTVSRIALGIGKSPEPPECPRYPHGSGFQISHSEKFDKSHGQKGLALVSQLTLYNASSRAPAAGPRLWAKPQSQRRRRPKRVGVLQNVLIFGPAAAGPADTAALRHGPLRDRVGLQISHSEKFDNSHGQKELQRCLS